MKTPSLDDCVQVLVKNPDHPRAEFYAKKLIVTMNQYVETGRLTTEKRAEYHRLLSPLLHATT